MVKKARNNVRLSGLLYDAKLEKKVTGPNSKSPGTEYITGKISIAVDDALTNIVDIRYPYVVPTTVKDGVSNPNPIYGILDTVTADYSNLDFNASEIQSKLADPENMKLLKDILTKLG